jgi:hypothetical protein
MANKPVNIEKMLLEYQIELSNIRNSVMKQQTFTVKDATRLFMVANTLLGLTNILLGFEDNKEKLNHYIEGLKSSEDISSEDDA